MNYTYITRLLAIASIVLLGMRAESGELTPAASQAGVALISSSAASLRLALDIPAITAAQSGAELPFGNLVGTDPTGNTMTRWVLIPPTSGVEVQLTNLITYPESVEANIDPEHLPAEFIRVGTPAILRGYRMAPLYISAQTRDPVTGAVTLLESAEIELDFTSGRNRENQVVDPSRSRPSRYARKLVESMVVNPPAPSRDDSVEGGSILYIIGDWNSFDNALQVLVEWRRRLGWKVEVVRVNDNTDRVAIKNAIQAAYNEWDVPPEYVVLAGDAPGMRGNDYVLAYFNEQNGANYAYESDQPYVCLEGNDLLPDAAIGRLPTNSLSLLNRQINKIIAYESTPYIGQNANERGWQLRGAAAATDSRSGGSSIDVCRWFEDMALHHGFTRVDDFFFTENEQQPDPTNFLNTQISSGISMLLYRGWSDMNGYDPDAINRLRNGQMLPFVMLATCNTGEYAVGNGNSPWTYTEMFQIVSAGGAIGSVGAAGATHSAYNNILASATMRAPFVEKIHAQGWALQQGKIELMKAYQGRGDIMHEENRNMEAWLTEYYIFNLMGDPVVELQTSIPRALRVTHPESFRPGETRFPVSVVYTDNNQPAQGVRICLYKNTDLQQLLTTDANGSIDFTLVPEWALQGQTKLTVSGPGLIPYLADINVSAVPFMLSLETWSIDDDNDNGTSGDGDSEFDAGETIDLAIQIKNSGQQRPNGEMLAIWRSDNPLLSVAEDTIRLNQAPAVGQSIRATFRVEVSGGYPNEATADLEIGMVAAGNEFAGALTEVVHAPEMRLVRVRWVGNQIRPGSSAEMNLNLLNIGPSAMPESAGRLISLTSTVTVDDDETAYPAINPNEQGTTDNSLTISASSSHIGGNPALFALILDDGNGLVDTVAVSIPIGMAVADQPFGPDRFGYICLDATDDSWPNRPGFNWLEINRNLGGRGVATGMTDTGEDDDKSCVVDLPFQFRYYGSRFNRITICTNGWAALGDHHTVVVGRNRPIPSGEVLPAMLCPFWDDLITVQGGGVYYFNDAQNHRFIVEWSRMRKLGPRGDQEPRESFQLILFDPEFHRTASGNGEIVFQYQEVTDNGSCFQRWDTPFATVGIVSPDQSDGLQYTYWGSRTGGAAVLQNSSVIKFTTDSGLAPGVLMGLVTDAITGAPVNRAQVTLSTGFNATTDQNGLYVFEALMPDTGIRATASMLFYNDRTITGVSIAARDTTILDFTLLRPIFSVNQDSTAYETSRFATVIDTLTLTNYGNGVLIFTSEVRYIEGERIRGPERVYPSKAGIQDGSTSGSDSDWLEISTDGDTLDADESIPFSLRIDASEQSLGVYNAEIVFTHNARPGEKVIPVHLVVSLSAPDDASLPHELSLLQNYPNPFNAFTTIEYTLPVAGDASLTVLDLLGREKLRLAEGYQSAGKHSARVTADMLPTGVYLYRLKSADGVLVKKLALLK
jgi:hypothetical protein